MSAEIIKLTETPIAEEVNGSEKLLFLAQKENEEGGLEDFLSRASIKTVIDALIKTGKLEADLVIRGTPEGGTILGDLVNNRALAPFTTSFGTGTIAGVKGYFYSNIDFSGENPVITLSRKQTEAESEAFEIGYEVGDIICMVNDSKYPDCATITAIDGNVITVDSLPFTEVKDMTGNLAMDDYSIYVPTKPLAGVISLGYYAMAVGEDVWVMERASGGIGRNIRIYGQYSFGAGRDITISGYLGFGFGRKLEIGADCFGTGYNNKIKGGEGSFGSGKNGVIDANAAHGEGWQYPAGNLWR